MRSCAAARRSVWPKSSMEGSELESSGVSRSEHNGDDVDRSSPGAPLNLTGTTCELWLHNGLAMSRAALASPKPASAAIWGPRERPDAPAPSPVRQLPSNAPPNEP